jgi:hypothetical protein
MKFIGCYGVAATALLLVSCSPSSKFAGESTGDVKCDTWEDILLHDERRPTVYIVRQGCSGLSNGLDIAIDLDVGNGRRTTAFVFADGSWDLRYTDQASPIAKWIDENSLLISVGAVGAIHKKLDKVGDVRITYRIDHVLSEESPSAKNGQ